MPHERMLQIVDSPEDSIALINKVTGRLDIVKVGSDWQVDVAAVVRDRSC